MSADPDVISNGVLGGLIIIIKLARYCESLKFACSPGILPSCLVASDPHTRGNDMIARVVAALVAMLSLVTGFGILFTIALNYRRKKDAALEEHNSINIKILVFLTKDSKARPYGG
jgi:hypothetical protein